MIKINVITNNKNWLNYIKRPNYYLDKKRITVAINYEVSYDENRK